MTTMDELHNESDQAIELDANLLVCNAMTKKEWRARWGQLNPFAYATCPVSQMSDQVLTTVKERRGRRAGQEAGEQQDFVTGEKTDRPTPEIEGEETTQS